VKGQYLSLKLAYEPFPETHAWLLNPTIEYGRDRNNDKECPTPDGAKCYDRVPTLLQDIVKNVL